MQSFCSHCFASIIGVLPAPPPPNSTRSSSLYLSDTRLTCQTTWHPNARHEPQPPRRAPPELLKLMFTYGAHSCLFHDKRLLRCKTASMKREEAGRGGGGVYANGLQDKKKTQLTGFKLAVAREARAWWDFFLLLFFVAVFLLILLMFCAHGQAKKKNAQEVRCR